jgi:hypothetical protein
MGVIWRCPMHRRVVQILILLFAPFVASPAPAAVILDFVLTNDGAVLRNDRVTFDMVLTNDGPSDVLITHCCGFSSPGTPAPYVWLGYPKSGKLVPISLAPGESIETYQMRIWPIAGAAGLPGDPGLVIPAPPGHYDAPFTIQLTVDGSVDVLNGTASWDVEDRIRRLSEPQHIPEPTAVWLLALGLITVAFRRSPSL